MTLRETRVYLHRVGELDDGLAVLRYFEIALAAFEIFLLLDVWVALHPRERHQSEREIGSTRVESHSVRLSEILQIQVVIAGCSGPVAA